MSRSLNLIAAPHAGMPFTQMMTFPTILSLRTTRDGVRLCREPVDAIASLRARTYDFSGSRLTDKPLLAELKGDAWDIEAVTSEQVGPIVLHIAGDEYVYHPSAQMLNGTQGGMPIPLSDGRLTLRVLVDRTTVEIFGDKGQAYGLFTRSNPGGSAALGLSTPYGEVQFDKLTIHSLRSAWTPPYD